MLLYQYFSVFEYRIKNAELQIKALPACCKLTLSAWSMSVGRLQRLALLHIPFQ